MSLLCCLVLILLVHVAYNSNIKGINPSVFEDAENNVLASLHLPNSSETLFPSQSFKDVPVFMVHLYKIKNGSLKRASRKLTKQLRDDTVRVFFSKGKKRRKIAVLITEFTLNFDLSAVRMNEEKLSYVELRLHRRKSKMRNKFGVYSVAIFGRPTSLSRTKRNKESFLGIKMFPNSRKSNWISFNVTRAVRRYLKNVKHKPKFKIYVQVHGRAEWSSSWISLQGKRRPFLVVFSSHLEKSNRYLDINLLKHAKKTINHSKEVRSRKKRDYEPDQYCQRHRLFVKFRLINVNWVIAPSGFTANYCRGHCPEILSSYFNPTNHAILQSLIHHRKSEMGVPSTSCVPTKLHSLTLLYIEEGGAITLREFPQMVVSKCGCL